MGGPQSEQTVANCVGGLLLSHRTTSTEDGEQTQLRRRAFPPTNPQCRKKKRKLPKASNRLLVVLLPVFPGNAGRTKQHL